MELRFVRSESRFTYFEATQSYLKHHGKPVAFYSDKHGTLHVNATDEKSGDGYTQDRMKTSTKVSNRSRSGSGRRAA